MYNDVMLDLETLGKVPGSTVLSIGAVAFNFEGLGEQFHMVISRQASADAGFSEDLDTVAWWGEQSYEAQETLRQADEAGLPILFTLGRFMEFLGRQGLGDGDTGRLRVWGNGAGFDQPLLRAYYAREGLDAPWNWWNDRCFRTLKGLAPWLPMERTGTFHNALDDAVTQARHAVKVFQALRVNASTLG